MVNSGDKSNMLFLISSPLDHNATMAEGQWSMPPHLSYHMGTSVPPCNTCWSAHFEMSHQDTKPKWQMTGDPVSAFIQWSLCCCVKLWWRKCWLHFSPSDHSQLSIVFPPTSLLIVCDLIFDWVKSFSYVLCSQNPGNRVSRKSQRPVNNVRDSGGLMIRTNVSFFNIWHLSIINID